MVADPGPLVSVITAVFNGEATLRRAHDSVREQQHPWQHIIVNDGSTDRTAEIIASMEADPRVISTSRPNGGPGASLNTGLDLATGAYVAFLDADDEYLPNHITAHIDRMEAAPHIDILWGGIEVVAERDEDLYVPDVIAGTGLIHISQCVVQGTIFARRHVFETLRFSEDRQVWWQDYDFISRARDRFAVEKFEIKTYRYYRGHNHSIVEAAKAEMRAKAASAG